jgi:hypothetical protein
MRYKKLIEDVITVGLIFLWSYAAALKVLNHQRFLQEISWFPILKLEPVFIAVAFPVAISITAVMMAIEKTRLKGLVASAATLIVMTVYLIFLVNFSEELPCSCSSIWENLEWKDNILINLGLIIVNLIAILLRKEFRFPKIQVGKYKTQPE